MNDHEWNRWAQAVTPGLVAMMQRQQEAMLGMLPPLTGHCPEGKAGMSLSHLLAQAKGRWAQFVGVSSGHYRGVPGDVAGVAGDAGGPQVGGW